MTTNGATLTRSIEQDQAILDSLVDVALEFVHDLRTQPGQPKPGPMLASAIAKALDQLARIVRRTILLKHSLPKLAAAAAHSPRDAAEPRPAKSRPDRGQRTPSGEPHSDDTRLDSPETLRADLEELRRAGLFPPPASPIAGETPIARLDAEIDRIAARYVHLEPEPAIHPTATNGTPPPRPPTPD